MIKELFTNNDNRLSTTGTVQFLGFLVLAATLIYSVYMGRGDVTDLYLYFAAYCGGLTASKGVVSAYRHGQEVKADLAKQSVLDIGQLRPGGTQ